MAASIVAAPSSTTTNQAGERDCEMKQSRKGQQWHLGMKRHVGVNDESGLVHSLSTDGLE